MNQDLDHYLSQGYLLKRGLISRSRIDDLNARIPDMRHDDEGIVCFKENSGVARSIFRAHRHDEVARELAQGPEIAGFVNRALGEDFYIWHSKINVKAAFEGAVWLWHQDYGYWKFDGVEKNRFVSVMIFLDRSTVQNGCLMIVPGSHHWGDLDHYSDEKTTSYKQWCITPEVLRERIHADEILNVEGEPGDVLFFDGNLVHGSSHNMSPLMRKTYIVCYNAVSNKPQKVDSPRPDWVVSRDFEAVRV